MLLVTLKNSIKITEALLPLWVYGGLRPTMWILGIEQAYMITGPLRAPQWEYFHTIEKDKARDSKTAESKTGEKKNQE